MRRPTVLHVVRDWVRPSERFVVDLVATTTATRAVVATGRKIPGIAETVAVPVHDFGRIAGADSQRARDRRAIRAALLATTVGERAQLLHAHFGYWAAHAGRTAQRLRRPWLLSLHGHDLLVEDPTAPERDVLRTATLVVVPSRFLADAASAAGFADESIRVMPSGVDLAGLPFRERRLRADGEIVVTFAGRFVAKKGVLDAAEALVRVARDVPGLRAVFVGTGPLEADLRAILAASSLRADIRDGSQPDAVRTALAETDVAVVPSRTAPDGDAETLGLVAVEAQACGVPLVVTRHGGLVDAVSPWAGDFVPEADPAALAAAISGLVQAPERWAEMGRAGRRHVAANFELGARTAAIEDAYRAVLAGGRPAPAPARRSRSSAAGPAVPKATVVMVTHNRRNLCRRSLAAIRAQSYDTYTVVVVDNASTDGTSEDLAAVSREDSRVRVITAAEHLPPAAARNRAVAASSGDVVAFTDDDCYPTPTWLEALVAGFEAVPGIGIVQGRTTADPQGWIQPLSRTQWTPAEFGLYETANIAYRRDSLGEAPFDETFARRVATVLGPRIGRYPFGEDTELAWRVKRRGVRSAFSATAVVHHHVYDPDVSYLIRRSVIAAGFPLVIRQVPELRDVFLWRRIFLGRRHAALVLAVLAMPVAASRRPVTAAAMASPYFAMVTRPRARGRRERLRAAPVQVARDVIELAAVGYGAIRARSLVL